MRPAAKLGSAWRAMALATLVAAVLPACRRMPPANPPAPLFEDVTQRAGLSFIHDSGLTGKRYLVEILGAGGALLDVDRDGDLDLVLRQSGPFAADGATAPPIDRVAGDRLFRNDLRAGPDGKPELRFVEITAGSGLDVPAYGLGVATGDVDGDGLLDLYLTNFGPNRLLRNRGDGTFEDFTTGSVASGGHPTSVAATFFDSDGDGDLDLYVGQYTDFNLAKHRECRAPSTRLDYCGPLSYGPTPGRLLRNGGDGRFTEVTAEAGMAGVVGNILGAAAADVDDDGDLDLFVGSDALENQLWINDGKGRFADEALLRGVAVNARGERTGDMGVDFGDFDGDGDFDLVATHIVHEMCSLWVNEGDGSFTDRATDLGLGPPTAAFTGFGTGFLDFDSDGWLDLVFVNGAVHIIEELERRGDPFPFHQRGQLFHNQAGRRFVDSTAAAGSAFEPSLVGRGALIGDLDNDGDLDLVATSNQGPARVLLARAADGRPWLGLRLVGRAGGDRLGARVEIELEGAPALVRHVHTDGSYASARDPRVVAGLAGRSAVTGIRVVWPGGTAERFAVPSLSAYHVLTEGEGTVDAH